MQIASAIITIFFHVVLPFALLWILSHLRDKNRFYQLGIFLATTSYLIFISIAGAGWAMISKWWIMLFILLYFPVCFSFAKLFIISTWSMEKKFKPMMKMLFVFIFAGLFTIPLPELFSARKFNENPVSLMFPLKNGEFFIGHGGSNESLNYHQVTKAQSYALDVLKLNQFGLRARGLAPLDLNQYEIFSESLYSPCDGEVLLSQNGLKDLDPGNMDAKNLLGNHLVIHCIVKGFEANGVSIVLAHMKNGSVLKAVGESVKKGELIGAVGNSGNTSEPHLHIHAVLGRVTNIEELANSGTAVPMVFDGRFYVRNDVVKN